MRPEQEQRARPERKLFKGVLRPVPQPPTMPSYTVAPMTKEEVTIRSASDRIEAREPTEIRSVAVAQPFVDPSVLERCRKQSQAGT